MSPDQALSAPTDPAPGEVPDAEPTAVPPFTRELRLVSIDESRNRARFYALQWQPLLWGGAALICQWGRIGTRGRAQVLLETDRPRVAAAIHRLLNRRLRHGYQVVDWH